jgi:hypothetical protein
MRLVVDWPVLLRRAWSVRLAILSAGLSAVEFALPFLAPERPGGWFAGAAVLVSLAAAAARLVAQPKSLP